MAAPGDAAWVNCRKLIMFGKKGEFKIVQMDSHHGHHAQKVAGVSFEANCGQIMDFVNPVDDN